MNLSGRVAAFLSRMAAERVFRRRVIGMCSAALVPAFAALYVLVSLLASMGDIRLVRHPHSWIVLDRNYRFLSEIKSPEGLLGYWPMPDTVPRTVRLSVCAAEDRRFDSHPGVDIRSVCRAVINNYVRHRGYSGASTVAMQLARLQRGGKSSWLTKARDSFAALGLVARYGHTGVLRQFLTVAPYGNFINGIACASRRYFRKSVEDLSLAEASLLVAIPRAPGRMNLFSPRGFERARTRARVVVNRCALYGWISETERRETLAELSTFSLPVRECRDNACIHAILSYQSLFASSQSSYPPLVVSSLDLALQEKVQESLSGALERLGPRDVDNAAIMVLDKNSAEVLAYIGSGGYFLSGSGAIDHGAIPRSTGSLLKPFIYGLGMEVLGHTAATVLTDINFDFGRGHRSFIPENCDRKYLGPVLYKTALANSRNIPAVKVLKEVGVATAYYRLVEAGIAPDDGRAEYYGLGLSIGGLYCDLRSLCRAYLAFGNKGKIRDLQWEKGGGRGNGQPAWKRIMPPDIALMLQHFLSDPLARLPTFPRGGSLEYPFAAGVKTGTSEGFRDSWCIAWSDSFLVGAWLGNADNHPTKSLSGCEGAAPLVKEVLAGLHPKRYEGLEDHAFPPPAGYRPIAICSITGLRADRNTPYTTVEYFKPGTEPLEYSRVQRQLLVDKRNGLLVPPGCNGHAEYRSFLQVEPEFYEWAQKQGLAVAPQEYSPGYGVPVAADSCRIEVVCPRPGSRFFVDPEMPPQQAVLPVKARCVPEARHLVWFVNGEEYAQSGIPHTLNIPMRPGKYHVAAAVAGRPQRSATVRFEIF
jgi:penicillin-binding protein 1C